MTVPAVGDTAPDFSLRDQNNEVVTLSDFRGSQAVLVVFYPAAFTGTCTGELSALRDRSDVFETDTVQVVTISVDSVFSHKIFATREGFEFPLLADFWPHGAVAQAYGVFDETRGLARRGTFLVDDAGVVRFAEVLEIGQAREPQVWVDAITALAAS